MNNLSAALTQIPSARLFLMHPLNRRLIEGADGRTSYETQQLKQTCSLWVLTALLIVSGIFGLTFFFNFVRENIIWIWLLAFAPVLTAAVVSYFEFDLQRQLRTRGTAIDGRIVRFELTGSDPTTAVTAYEFLSPDGEKILGQTKELLYLNDSHFYISRAPRRFGLIRGHVEPEPGDRVVVLYLDAGDGHCPTGKYDIL